MYCGQYRRCCELGYVEPTRNVHDQWKSLAEPPESSAFRKTESEAVNSELLVLHCLQNLPRCWVMPARHSLLWRSNHHVYRLLFLFVLLVGNVTMREDIRTQVSHPERKRTPYPRHARQDPNLRPYDSRCSDDKCHQTTLIIYVCVCITHIFSQNPFLTLKYRRTFHQV